MIEERRKLMNPIVSITRQLNSLADYREQQARLDSEKQALIDTVLTPEIKAQIEAIEAEFAGRDEVVAEKIAEMEASIKRAALANDLSVRSDRLQVIIVQRTDKWNGKGLSSYAKTHPDINKYRSSGARYAQIRASKT